MKHNNEWDNYVQPALNEQGSAVLNRTWKRPVRQISQDALRLRELQISYFERKEAYVADLQEFFGSDMNRLVSMTLEVNVLDLLMTQRAVMHLLSEWQMVRECRYDEDEATLVKRLAVEVAPGKYDFVIRWGRQFWRSPDGQKVVVDYWANEDRRVEESEITFTVPTSEHARLQSLLPELKKWANQNHFVRNHPVNADGSFIKMTERVLWEDVIIPPALREALERNCIDLLAHAALYRANGVPLRRGIVLHGPPGTGKTMIGRALAQRCGITFILATPGMFESPKDVRRMFHWGRRFAPAILFFEDFDLVAGNRHGGGRRDIVGEFLSCLDGLDSHEGIIAIATTNDLKAIEPAMKDRPNRFDCVLEVGAPGLAERVLFLQRWVHRSIKDSAANADAVTHTFNLPLQAERTEGFTGAQMQELCRLAVFEAVEQQVRKGVTDAVRLPLCDEHFDAALKRMGVRRRKRVGFQAAE